jgi:hypothetical protein
VEIHKPKAAHSWREFLIEIGTIVCGIVIALGGEQVVEMLHRTGEVREAREALKAEIGNDVDILKFGLEETKCLLPQASAFAAWTRGGGKPPPFRSLLNGFQVGTWDTVKSNAIPLMPLRERLAITDLYNTLANAQKIVDLQRSSAIVLIGADQRSKLSEVDAGRVLDAVAVQYAMANFYKANARGAMKAAADFGVRSSSLDARSRLVLNWECGHGDAPPIP